MKIVLQICSSANLLKKIRLSQKAEQINLVRFERVYICAYPST